MSISLPILLVVKVKKVLLIFAELYLELQFDNKTFKVTAMVHPSTYLNKILFGSRQGSLQLWNIHKSKLLYTFPGWGASVTVLEQVSFHRF